jgi:hypothetical protein
MNVRDERIPAPGGTDSTFERHFSIQGLSKLWNFSRETIRTLFKNEPGVLKVRLGTRKANTRYSIPESVARRGNCPDRR